MTLFRPAPRAVLAGGIVLALCAGSALAVTPEEVQQKLDEGRLAGALESATELTETAPDDCAGWRLLGDANRRLGRAGNAILAYRKAFDICPDDPALLKPYGRTLVESEFDDEAVRILAKLWALDTSDPEVASSLGSAAYASGNCAEGKKAYESLLAAHPGRAADRLGYAQLLSRVCRDFAAADVEFQKLRAANPNDVMVTCAHVYALAGAGRADDAARVASEALAAVGTNNGCLYAAWGRALEAAADSLMALGDVEPARALYQQAVDPLTKGSDDPVFGPYCQSVLAEVRYKESPMEVLTP
jgi:predicted Zn-dependent protease